MRMVTQSPVSRETLRQWVEDPYGVYMDVHQNDTGLRLMNEDIFPEISVLFIGGIEHFTDMAEICGLYDHRTRRFQFVSGQLSSIADGILKTECYTGTGGSEEIYAEICRYAKEAVEQKGYSFENSGSTVYAGLRQAIQSGLSDMVDYTALLSARGAGDAVRDVRDLALEMLYFWRDPVYDIYEKGYAKLEREYTEKLNHAALSEQIPAFSAQKAANILRSLAIHAAETTENEDSYSVWECCHVAKRLLKEYPQQGEAFQGDFTADWGERFTQFGSMDWERMQEGRLAGKPVLVFHHPIPDGQIPEGWRCYHLGGRNFRNVDKLLKEAPENGYIGTVLSPYVLIRAGYHSRQIQNQFICMNGYVSLAKFCGKNHLALPDVNGIPFEQQEQPSAPNMEMGGM